MYTEEKGWGREIIFADTPDYCGKLMIFNNVGSKFSMHYHIKKDESWYVQQGKFKLTWIDTVIAEVNETILERGASWRNLPGEPHQLEALESGSIIFEVSTEDTVEDNYRIFPGDSQT